MINSYYRHLSFASTKMIIKVDKARKQTRKYQVGLTENQVATIEKMFKDRKVSSTIIDRRRLLLLLDENHRERYSHAQVAAIAGVCHGTVPNVSKIYAEGGLVDVPRTPTIPILCFKLSISLTSANACLMST